MKKERASRNRTLAVSEEEIPILKKEILTLDDLEQNHCEEQSGVEFSSLKEDCFATVGGDSVSLEKILDRTINADIFNVLPFLPDEFADLIIIDPPYNLTRNFGGKVFSARSEKSYDEYLSSWFPLVCKKLKLIF